MFLYLTEIEFWLTDFFQSLTKNILIDSIKIIHFSLFLDKMLIRQ